MAKKNVAPSAARLTPVFDLQSFLDSAGTARTITKFAPKAVVFSQGDAATHVFYLQEGVIKLSVLSRSGKSAVVATLGPGDFFGEGSLAGQSRRMATAVALRASKVLVIEKPTMVEMLRTQPTLADRRRRRGRRAVPVAVRRWLHEWRIRRRREGCVAPAGHAANPFESSTISPSRIAT